jgi:hypothetical protein
MILKLAIAFLQYLCYYSDDERPGAPLTRAFVI